MEIFCKKNTNLTYQELEVLFQLYLYNNKKIFQNFKNITSMKLKNMETDNYKKEWIKSILENDKLLCIECVESNYLIAFALLEFNENENYIREMHIVDTHQKDGITFKKLVETIFNHAQVGKDFTGRIFEENYNAKKVFKSMGALLVNGKYQLSYQKTQEWMNKHVKEEDHI